MIDRRQWVAGFAAATAGTFAQWKKGFGADAILPLPGGPDARPVTSAFPQKRGMILQRTRPPLLETPFDVFDQGLLTPNDRTYVRWHWSGIPPSIDARAYRLAVRGAVNRTLSLSLDDLKAFPRFEVVAVNQCTGNSRGFFLPRVAGGQWANGAMANARWTGVRLRDVLDRAEIKAEAVQVRFKGLDEPLANGPKYMKSLDIDKARDGDVMIAWAMNGEPLPFLNGYPIRLVVPGWFATYWMKMLNDIEVLSAPDDNYWMATAYRIPNTPHADIAPGQTGVKTIPVSAMPPRSFITNLREGGRIRRGHPARVRGIAFGGDAGVAKVEFSSDAGQTWQIATLGPDEGKFGFRAWSAQFVPSIRIEYPLMVRCTNSNGLAQPDRPNWNPGGYLRNVVERITVLAT